LGTVRLRLDDELLAGLRSMEDRDAPPWSIGDLELDDRRREALRRNLERWGRAVTGRRVGLALGGGGAFGFVHIPLIEALVQEDIPIDMVSGSSFGAVVGAYYCGGGLRGLHLLKRAWLRFTAASYAALVSTASFQWLIDADLGAQQLEDLETPLFPIVADADVGLEWDIRRGSLGTGVRASGSLPPLAPTILGDRRYLDGGLVANVPIQVLQDEGADLIIASNPIPSPPRRERARSRFPKLSRLVRETNPLERLDDALRSTLMLMRSAGDAQASDVDVMYRADTTGHSMSSFRAAEDIIGQCERSTSLAEALAQAQNRWRSLLKRPSGRIRLDASSHRVWVDAWFAFAPWGSALDELGARVMDELAQFLEETPQIEALLVRAFASSFSQEAQNRALAARRAEAVVSELVSRGVSPRRLRSESRAGAPARPPVGIARRAPRDVEFVVTGILSMGEVSERLTQQREAARRNERMAREAQALGLTALARNECERGDLELGRLLALEAAAAAPSATTAETLRLALLRSGRTIWALREDGPFTDLVFGPEGARVALVNRQGSLRVVDARSGEERARLEGRGPAAQHVVAWGAGGLLAVAGGGRLAVIRPSKPGVPRSLRRVATVDLDVIGRPTLRFSPTGKALFVSERGSARAWVWRRASGLVERERIGDGGGATAHWSPDGRRAALVGSSATLTLAELGEPDRRVELSWDGPPELVAWSPDSSQLAVARASMVHLLEAATGHPSPPVDHASVVRALAWSPDGRWIARATDAPALIVSPSAEPQRERVLLGVEAEVRRLLWLRGGEALGALGTDGQLRVWDLPTGRLLSRMVGPGGALRQVEVSPRGNHLLSRTEDGRALLWEPFSSGARELSGPPWSGAAWHPNEEGRAVLCGEDGSVRLWDPHRGGRARLLLRPLKRRARPASAAWSAGGERLAVGRAGESRWWVGDPQAWSSAKRFELDTGTCERLSWSPDGSWVGIFGNEVLAVCDATTGRVGGRHHGASGVFAWAPDGACIALTSAEGSGGLVIGRVPERSGDLAWSHLGSGDFRSLCWSPDAMLLVAGAADGAIEVFERDGGTLLAEHRPDDEDTGAATALAWSPDEDHIAVGYASGRAVILRQDGLAPVGPGFRVDGDVVSLGWCPLGRRVAFRGSRGDALVVDAERCEVVATLDRSHRIRGVSWDPDGRRLLVAGEDGAARVHPIDFETLLLAVGEQCTRRSLTAAEWLRVFGPPAEARRDSWPRPASEGVGARSYRGHRAALRGVAWRPPGGRELVSSSWDGSVHVWSARNAELSRVLLEPDPQGEGGAWASWSPDGQRIALGRRRDDYLDVGCVESWERALAFDVRPATPDWIQWSNDGRRVAVAGNRHLAVCDGATARPVASVPICSSGEITWVAWHPSNSDLLAVATSSEGEAVAVWDLRRGEAPTLAPEGHTDKVWRVHWSPDGAMLATACNDGDLRLYSLDSVHPIAEVGSTDPMASPRCMTWSADGQRIAVGYTTGRIVVYSLEGLVAVVDEVIHDDVIFHLDFSPVDLRLLSLSRDGSARIFDAMEPSEPIELGGGSGRVNWAVWSPDGRQVATATADGMARIQPVDVL
jgi:WD40 repeat protein/predicted acylesterase/phospholipase RssA